MKFIRRGTSYTQERSVIRNDREETVLTQVSFELSYIFECPGCVYKLPCLTQEGAETTRSLHMQRCCPEQLVDAHFQDTFDPEFLEMTTNG